MNDEMRATTAGGRSSAFQANKRQIWLCGRGALPPLQPPNDTEGERQGENDLTRKSAFTPKPPRKKQSMAQSAMPCQLKGNHHPPQRAHLRFDKKGTTKGRELHQKRARTEPCTGSWEMSLPPGTEAGTPSPPTSVFVVKPTPHHHTCPPGTQPETRLAAAGCLGAAGRGGERYREGQGVTGVA